MTDISNFRQLAPYVLYIYTDNTVEWLNRNYLPIGVSTEDVRPEVELARVPLSENRINRLREMGEERDDKFVICLYEGSQDPDAIPRTINNKNNYFTLLNKINRIIYGW